VMWRWSRGFCAVAVLLCFCTGAAGVFWWCCGGAVVVLWCVLWWCCGGSVAVQCCCGGTPVVNLGCSVCFVRITGSLRVIRLVRLA